MRSCPPWLPVQVTGSAGLQANQRRKAWPLALDGEHRVVAVWLSSERGGGIRPHGGYGGDMGRSDGALTRLILIVVTWSKWRPAQDQPEYEQFTGKFLRASSAHSDGVSPVYMHQCFQTDHRRTGRSRDDPYAADNEVPITHLCTVCGCTRARGARGPSYSANPAMSR